MLIDNAIADAGVERPESGHGVGDRSSRGRDFDGAASGGEFAQGSGNVDGDRHGYLRVERRDFCRLVDLEAVAGLDGVVCDSFTPRTGMVEPSSTMADRTHTIEGKLSWILFQVLPSSFEPKS